MAAWLKQQGWAKHVQRNTDSMRGQPRRICVVDTETTARPGNKLTQQIHSLRLGVAVFGCWDGSELRSLDWFQFTRSADFWDWLTLSLSWQRKTVLYAHNAHFDLTILDWWNQVLKGNFRTNSDRTDGSTDPARATRKRKKWRGQVVLERNPYFIQSFNKRGRLDIVDTCNYYSGSLKTLGDSVGLPKFEMPPTEASDREWFAYCRRDVEIALQAMLNLLREWNANNYGPFGYTLPSLAYRAWEHTFCDCKPVPHDNSEVRELERRAYFGGRSAAWFVGDVVPVDYNRKPNLISESATEYAQQMGQVYILDVRSMYPSVMLRKDYPIKLLYHLEHPSLESVADLIQDYCLVADCTIRTNDPEYPHRSNGKVTYPVGMYNTSLCTPELHYAIDSGAIAAINYLAVYSAGQPFNSYVQYWWQRRQKALSVGDATLSELCKLMLNSLYGKFGMRLSTWVNYPAKMGLVPWGQWWTINAQTGVFDQWRSIGYHAQRKQERGEHPKACPAVAAHVTSYGRMKMRAYRACCPLRSILYQDTDSLFVLADGYHALKSRGLLDDTGLGALRLTHVVDHLAIRGVKNYTADGREVIAGINPNQPQFGPRCWLAPEFAGPATVLHSGLSGTIPVEIMLKRADKYHCQDSINPDGYSEPPLLL